ncbi:hypothetical protein ACFLUS_01600 [Chloroflexota bacterium]
MIDDFKGKKTIAIFYLDKDVDDMLRITYNSSHLVYTKYYDVYNHMFAEGNIGEGLAAAASLDPRFVQSRVGDCQILRSQLANLWKDWVKLCLFAVKKKINSFSNYGFTSKVNKPHCGSLDDVAYANHINEMKANLGLTDKQFNRAFSRISKLVDEIYSSGFHDQIFKGKWYGYLFTEYIRTLNNNADCNGLDNRLPSCIAAIIDFDQPWSEYFKQPLRQLISNV